MQAQQLTQEREQQQKLQQQQQQVAADAKVAADHAAEAAREANAAAKAATERAAAVNAAAAHAAAQAALASTCTNVSSAPDAENVPKVVGVSGFPAPFRSRQETARSVANKNLRQQQHFQQQQPNVPSHQEPGLPVFPDADRHCHICLGAGHWAKDCPQHAVSEKIWGLRSETPFFAAAENHMTKETQYAYPGPLGEHRTFVEGDAVGSPLTSLSSCNSSTHDVDGEGVEVVSGPSVTEDPASFHKRMVEQHEQAQRESTKVAEQGSEPTVRPSATISSFPPEVEERRREQFKRGSVAADATKLREDHAAEIRQEMRSQNLGNRRLEAEQVSFGGQSNQSTENLLGYAASLLAAGIEPSTQCAADECEFVNCDSAGLSEAEDDVQITGHRPPSPAVNAESDPYGPSVVRQLFREASSTLPRA